MYEEWLFLIFGLGEMFSLIFRFFFTQLSHISFLPLSLVLLSDIVTMLVCFSRVQKRERLVVIGTIGYEPSNMQLLRNLSPDCSSSPHHLALLLDLLHPLYSAASVQRTHSAAVPFD